MLSEELLLNCSKVTNITTEHLMELVKENQNNDDASDATWILTSAFIIFTMQSGFGLLEAGTVSSKNETNIMVKNALDVIFGALGYWVCGFAFSFGDDKNYANGFSGFGNFFVDVTNEDFGHLFSKYFFQLSFATTATTIVSGAMAERTNLKAYMFFSLVNFLSYVFPAHWIWDKNGFLKKRDVVDVAGCGPVHIVGGSSALIATIMLKPRQGIFDKNAVKANMASPTNVMLGTFMLWWGWLGFNCGSTFGVSGGKWKLASRTAVITVNGSVGGGLWSIIYCYCLTKRYNKKLDVSIFTSSILGGLVSITAICGVCRPWEALCIGFVGGMITCYGSVAVEALKIDDPVTCIPIHLFCGTWGLLAVGLFANRDTIGGLSANDGVLKGGNIIFLGYQCLTIVCVAAWSCIATSIQLFIADLIFGLRLSPSSELVGADISEHGLYMTKERRRSKVFGSKRDDATRGVPPRADYIRSEGITNFGVISIEKNEGTHPEQNNIRSNTMETNGTCCTEKNQDNASIGKTESECDDCDAELKNEQTYEVNIDGISLDFSA